MLILLVCSVLVAYVVTALLLHQLYRLDYERRAALERPPADFEHSALTEPDDLERAFQELERSVAQREGEAVQRLCAHSNVAALGALGDTDPCGYYCYDCLAVLAPQENGNPPGCNCGSYYRSKGTHWVSCPCHEQIPTPRHPRFRCYGKKEPSPHRVKRAR